MQFLNKAAGMAIALLLQALPVSAEPFDSPEILIIGDSQISFGSGPAFLEFFSNIKTHCKPNAEQKQHLEQLGKMRVGVIGVRSSSIPSWTARSGKGKDTICKVDPKWRVNAGAYGFVNKSGNKYVQIGEGRDYQFCAANTSPLEEMLRDDYYDPKLILMSFLGNSAKRWANSPEAAIRDVQKLKTQLPPDLPCIFMTTAPAYKKKIVDLRLRAQKNLMDAFKTSGLRCSFVPGSTPETVAANQGNKEYFRLNKKGMVKDPYHPNEAAAKNFFALEMDQICTAIFTQISPTKEQS